MILTYHEIVPEPSRYVYSATVMQLTQQLAALRTLPENVPVPAVTFDDGHSSHHRYALQVLESERFRGIFFITVGWTGDRSEYMSWKQLRELAAQGHQIQSHGWSHALLTRCTPSELKEELQRSRLTLEDRLGFPVDSISIPGGRWNDRVLIACQEQGYRKVFVSDPYLLPQWRGGVMLTGRIMIRREHDVAQLLSILHSTQTRWSVERARYGAKQILRATVGDQAYHRLWRWLGSSSERSAINRCYMRSQR